MKWEPEEVQRLIDMFDAGDSKYYMQIAFPRHTGAAIVSRLNAEGRYFSERKRAARIPKKDKVVTSKVVPERKSWWRCVLKWLD